MKLKKDKNMRMLNRDAIKYIAMLTMLLNHIANIFMTPRTFIYEAFIDIGYFTAITMCYFLVEGYEYTRSKKKYAMRLFLFAVISQVPYCMALTEDKIIEFVRLNMIFTLFLCFLIIYTVNEVKNTELKRIVIIFIIMLSLICDWGGLAPVFTLLFIRAGKSKAKLKEAFAVSAFSFGLCNFINNLENLSIGVSLAYAVGSALGIVLSGSVIVYLYNGKRMTTGRTFSKWFFYIFYPAHLLVLGIIRIMIM